MSELDAIISAVLAFALVVALAGLYYTAGRYIIRLRAALSRALRELAEVRAERDQARREFKETNAALQRATDGTDDILRAVRGEVPRG